MIKMNRRLLILLIIIFIVLVVIFIYNSKKTSFTNNEPKKIAFLFLIKDGINKEELWHNFFENVDTNKYSIYIHYKNNIKLKYFDKYKLSNTIPTKWGDISLVKAQKLLLKNALKDKNNYKFIFLSDSCIPIKNFNYVYDFLISNNNSYFNNFVKKKSKNSIIYKTFQWFILNKEHADIINNDSVEIRYYTKFFAPDELYFLTTILKKNTNNLVINKNTSDYTTYVHWGNNIIKQISDDFSNIYKVFKSIKTTNGASPYTYKTIVDEELEYLVNDTNCLFMRKIIPETILNKTLLPYG
jgi:hypothetical protein